jgi:bleomycin hydrolase
MKKLILTIGVFCAAQFFFAQTLTNKKGSEYKFTPVKNIEATGVQNQGQTGTCWSFSSLSYFESELIRMGKGKDFNLSEMFVVRMSYPQKAENYIRMHGKAQFAEGGEFHDVVNVIRDYGMVPEEIYNGNLKSGEKYNHHIMDSILLSMVKEIAKSDKTIDPSWKKNLEAKLDEMLGKVPQEFEWKGKKYTPQTFAKEMGIVPDDYVYISSFTHRPFYKKFVIEIPDNWAWEQAHNVQLNEMMETIDNALNNGFGVAWAADVSEPGFKFKEGLAILPEKPVAQMTEEEKKQMFIKPVPQLQVTPENRQLGFDNYETQDDHGMHITGIVKDQDGKKYYIVKNSWGKENECDGYFYASEEYVKMKTISIMVHRNAVPKALKAKLSIK